MHPRTLAPARPRFDSLHRFMGWSRLGEVDGYLLRRMPQQDLIPGKFHLSSSGALFAEDKHSSWDGLSTHHLMPRSKVIG